MQMADKFGLPIITLIDTAGAYPGIGAEERHIAEAIAVNLREMMSFEVPDYRGRNWRRWFRRSAGNRRCGPSAHFGKRLLFGY